MQPCWEACTQRSLFGAYLEIYWKALGGHQLYKKLNKKAASLHSLIADGKYRATSLGRNKWKKPIGSQASLQTNCNKEGFNAAAKFLH